MTPDFATIETPKRIRAMVSKINQETLHECHAVMDARDQRCTDDPRTDLQTYPILHICQRCGVDRVLWTPFPVINWRAAHCVNCMEVRVFRKAE